MQAELLSSKSCGKRELRPWETDDFFDDDDDEQLEQLDQMSQATATSIKQQRPPSGRLIDSENVTEDDLNGINNGKQAHQVNITTERDDVDPHATTAAPPAMLQHHVDPNTSKPKAMNKGTFMDTIRPQSWTSQSNHQDSSTNFTQSRPIDKLGETVDPRQVGLPRELQFVDIPIPDDEYRTQLVQNAAISKPLDNGWVLFNHQKRAILTSIRMRRQILALDMGLGKTLIGCCWARSFVRTFDCKVICVCPVSLQTDWKRTMEEATSLTVHGPKDKTFDANVQICSWAKLPDPLTEPYVVICDEAHAMQSMESARTRNALKLIRDEKVLGALLLTGTPLKNGQPSNLFPLLKAVQHPFGNHQKAYEVYFCEGRQVQMGPKTVWIAKGAAHLNQLRDLTQTHVLYLTKEECLQLPPQTRIVRKVSVSTRNELIHKEGLQRLSKAYFQDRERNSDALLGAFQNLRLTDAWAKVDATVQVAHGILETEPAVVVFTSFQDIASMIVKKLIEFGWSAELLTGNTPVAKRPIAVNNFQNGLSSAFVATFGAGGVGLTLTAASTVLLLDRPWTPGEAFQAEDRVRRIGQTKPVTSIWISAFDLDEQIDQLIQSKKQTADAVLAGDESTGGMQRISILKLLEKVLPRTV